MTVAIVVAGSSSGVGKTSVALGLMRALKRRGLKVQPFKVGPDYLDPIWHQVASGRTSYNLDAWMTSPEYVKQLFASKTANADVAIVEGVMGLFDGASPTGLSGSTAEIASLLNVPVLLVASAHGASRSFAATAKGFAEFEEQCQVTHMIANHCGSNRHAELLNESLTAATDVSLVGYMKRNSLPTLPSRHLGLSTPADQADAESTCEKLADQIDQNCEIDNLLNDQRLAADVRFTGSPISPPPPPFAVAGSTLAVAMDEAFFFYYPDNLELFQSNGVNIIYFSPIRDESVPDKATALYLGGGYPERFVQELSHNESMKRAIKQFADSGRPIYAECGGMMYLSHSIIDLDGKVWPMANVIPISTRMLPKKKRLGYTQTETRIPTILGPPGTTLRGHEFHYSEVNDSDHAPEWSHAYQVSNARGDNVRNAGYSRGNVLASYIHLHFASARATRHNDRFG